MDLMKPEIINNAEGKCELRFQVRPEFTIYSGIVQGGIVAVSTASLQYEILRPVRDTPLTATGTIVRSGRRIIFAEAEIRNDDGVLLAKGTQTAVPVSRPSSE
jgi:acyl-coenzyme A thioesterase PaaI-like protein